MLKPIEQVRVGDWVEAAAFGRLCVETIYARQISNCYRGQPPSGGCVLKLANTTRLTVRG